MSIANCTKSPPVPVNPVCGNVITGKGGICRLFVAECTIEDDIPDVTVAASWNTAQAAGKVQKIADVLGEIPVASPTKARVASCQPEKTTERTRTFNFKIYHTGSTDHTALINDLNDNNNAYFLAYEDTNGNVYSWVSEFDFEGSRVHEADKTGKMFWECVVTWERLDELTPAVMPDIDF